VSGPGVVRSWVAAGYCRSPTPVSWHTRADVLDCPAVRRGRGRRPHGGRPAPARLLRAAGAARMAAEVADLYEQATANQWDASRDVPWGDLKPLPEPVERAVCQLMTL